MNRTAKFALRTLGALAATYTLLLFPAPDPNPPSGAGRKPFLWNTDDRWFALEQQFVANRAAGCVRLVPRIDSAFSLTATLLESLSSGPRSPDDSLFVALESATFSLGPLIAACPARVEEFRILVSSLRSAIKRQSQAWKMDDRRVRERLYRLFYGTRAALEEVLLQLEPGSVSMVSQGVDEPSTTPAAQLLGVDVHSGDILVSRGGAPVSSLIARGNDFPGNFSHVALVHVDGMTGVATIIESHIERGVTVSTLEEYLRDIKLRVMILRVRHDLPALRRNPLLPHKAAQRALASARSRHIPYDFALDFRDSTKMFCSEVVSWAYRHEGIDLWKGMSTISSPGVVSWLAGFGVENFETQQPSDLEYDPQLQVAAEWRDAHTLFKDRVDNAVVDALLEEAEQGKTLERPWYALPLVRAAKGYSLLLNAFGTVGPVPEGMSASSALRHESFVKEHERMVKGVTAKAGEFRRERGYSAPYWELLQFAREAKAAPRK